VKTSFCLTVSVEPQCVEIAFGILYSHGCSGCSEEQQADGGTAIAAYFDNEENALAAARGLSAVPLLASPAVSPQGEEDWMARWRDTVRPVHVGNGTWVSPPWLAPAGEDVRHWIKIEPKMSFGTGHHESTWLAASMLSRVLRQCGRPLSVFDIGTGTGILCFIASIHGAPRMTGIDTDPACLENIAENRRLNPTYGPVSFAICSRDAIRPAARFGVIVMNLLFTQARPLLPSIGNMLSGPDSRIIWSGLLEDEKKDAVAAAGEAGLECAEGESKGEWWCGAFIL
jgi:ribosomal protein L11 methyltransferase